MVVYFRIVINLPVVSQYSEALISFYSLQYLKERQQQQKKGPTVFL